MPDFSNTSIAIIGVGLMGGSLGLAAQERLEVARVTGYSRTERTLQRALELGAITDEAGSIEEAAAGADIIFVATPVRSILESARRALAASKPGSIVTDMGSTKSSLMAALTAAEEKRFIGGHPVCGSETAGVGNSREDLFDNATWFLTSGRGVDPSNYERLHGFIARIGAIPTAIDPDAHDRIMALVSHLPHVLANSAMNQVGGVNLDGREALLSAGPSFRDLTRIAGSNPRVWTDIFMENSRWLVEALKEHRESIDSITAAVESGDEAALAAMINEAAANRDRMLEAENLAPSDLFVVKVPVFDKPGVLSQVTVALGNAGINIEDLAFHRISIEQGGVLSLVVSGSETGGRAVELLRGLGYDAVLVPFTDAEAG
ncbi:MAG: prephenate dehydrogenase/arogenate dehydrogenase family protein [Actinobacteria bacterium]|nr:prephenate dehydrogenase/arogenate dehydrogenase family protein [Actinomycetota bacterium]MCL5882690.1 prephenate dehydrogenase/arogenate dehydrogenase family protein [Actinomycetota bacterium]